MNSCAVIGLGSISCRHRRNLRTRFPDVRIIAMSASGRSPDILPENSDILVDSPANVISLKPELVVVASPATMHAIHAIPFLEANIATLIEKPLAASIVDARQLAATSRQSGTASGVGYCLRFHPAARLLKSVLKRGAIGRVFHVFATVGQYLPDWRPGKDLRQSVSANPDLGGGALLELSHELDYLGWLLGGLSFEHALLRRSSHLGIPVEAIADVTLTTDDGVVCHVHLDFLQRPANRHCTIVGETGRLECDLIANRLDLITSNSIESLINEPGWNSNSMYQLMLDEFIAPQNSIPETTGERHLCTLENAMQTVELIEEIKQRADWKSPL